MQKFYMSQRVKAYSLFIGCGVLLPLLFSCTPPEVQLPSLTVNEETVSQNYLLGPEDVVEVIVWKNPDLSRTASVRPDGKISLPLVGDLQAAGLTAVQLRDQIAEALKAYYKKPAQVSVIVQQINSYSIYILGEVRTPGRYVVKSGTTFLQAVTLAGGFTDFAAKSRIMLRRKGKKGGRETAMGIKYRDVVTGKQSNVLLKPGDTIIIP